MKMIKIKGAEASVRSEEPERSQNPESAAQPASADGSGAHPAPDLNEAGEVAKKARKKQASAQQPAPVEIKIDKIEIDDSIHPRDHVDKAAVRDYRLSMEDGDKFPPIHVFKRGGKYVVADGRHRLLAAKAAGFKTILAIVHDGDNDEAMLFAVEAVANEGVRRTNADKRKSVGMVLGNPAWRDWNDSEVARRCHVSADLVKDVKVLMAGGSHPPETGDKEAKLVRRGGSVYRQKTPGPKSARPSVKALNSALRGLHAAPDPRAAMERALGGALDGGGELWLETVPAKAGGKMKASLRVVRIGTVGAVGDGWSRDAADLTEIAVAIARQLGAEGRLHVLLGAAGLSSDDRERFLKLGKSVVVLGEAGAGTVAAGDDGEHDKSGDVA